MPKTLITTELLQSVAPHTSIETLQQLSHTLNPLLEKYEITSPKQIAAFLAQAAHETQGFTRFVENGGKVYFDRYEPGQPQGKVLGNTTSGDGLRFRGRGIFQLTGRWNYTHYGKLLKKTYPQLDLVSQPDKAADLDVGCHIACLYWKNKGLNQLAAQGNFEEITRRIKNPGLSHLIRDG